MVDNPFSSVEAMVGWQIEQVQRQAEELREKLKLPEVGKIFQRPHAKHQIGTPDNWAFGNMKPPESGLAWVENRITKAKIALTDGKLPDAIYIVIQANDSLWSVRAHWYSCAATSLWREHLIIGKSFDADPCAEFLLMKPKPEELTITFTPNALTESTKEALMVEVAARDITRRMMLDALGMIDRKSGKLNKLGGILLGLAKGKQIRKGGKIPQQVRRQDLSSLRKLLRERLGINGDPFTRDWAPRFKVIDNREAADTRAKQKAERRTTSYKDGRSFEHENDAAGQFIEENDPAS